MELPYVSKNATATCMGGARPDLCEKLLHSFRLEFEPSCGDHGGIVQVRGGTCISEILVM